MLTVFMRFLLNHAAEHNEIRRVVVANSSCLHLDLDLSSSFSFDVVSVSVCRMHMYNVHT